jgi:actin-related protein 6
MSNRPVPRAKPVETPVAETTEVAEPVVEEVTPVVEEVISVVKEVAPVAKKPAAPTEKPQSLADNVVKLRQQAEADEVKWRHAPIADVDVKFAVSHSHQLYLLSF